MPVTKSAVNSLSKSGSAKLKRDVTLSEGTNVTLTQTGNNIEIAAAGGSASPGGSDTQIQFNNGGFFGGSGVVYTQPFGEGVGDALSSTGTSFLLSAGDYSGVNANLLLSSSGEATLTAGDAPTSESDGNIINLNAGAGGEISGWGGTITLAAGSAQAGNGKGGDIKIFSGNGVGNGSNGNVYIKGLIRLTLSEDNVSALLDPYLLTSVRSFTFPDQAGTFIVNPPDDNTNIDINILAGNAVFGDVDGGSINIRAGYPSGSGFQGSVNIFNDVNQSGIQIGYNNFTGEFGNIVSIISPDGFLINNGVSNSGAILDTALIGGPSQTFTFPDASGTISLTNELSVYASGTAYSLTNSSTLLNFGTTDPTLVINQAGTYLIMARVRVDYNSSTFAAVRTATFKLRRTNNTAADLTGSSTSAKTDIITALSYTMGIYALPPVFYTTTNTDDSIDLMGMINTVPTAGSLDCVEASIVAIRLQ
jgi:hypothetical protein